ncbi:MAG: small multi-drug export protein [Kiritimatiellales bacterium]|nr:small multi-drug export protein [Kiritimatiellales bacterium]
MRKHFILLSVLISLAFSVPAEETVHSSRGEKIAVWLQEKGLSPDAAVAAISTLPIVELRGAVPVGIVAFKMPWWRVFLIAVAGNMIPIPVILLLLGPLSRACMKFSAGRKFFDWLFARTRKKSASIEKYEALGLTIFVAIPLPMTGAWTGAMAAFVMGIPFWKAMRYILLGVMIAGIIMTTLSLLGWIGAAIAGAVLIGLAVLTLARTFKPW